MSDLISRIRQRYMAQEITASEAYHAVCLAIEVLNNELGE